MFRFPWDPKPEMELFWRREVAGIGESSMAKKEEENILMVAIGLEIKGIVQCILGLGIFKSDDLKAKNDKGKTIDEMGRETYGDVLWKRWNYSNALLCICSYSRKHTVQWWLTVYSSHAANRKSRTLLRSWSTIFHFGSVHNSSNFPYVKQR